MTHEIGVQELLYQVKKELLAPSADDPVPLFYVASVDLELSVVARREGQAGIKLYVAEAGGSAGQERAQTVRISLQPLFSREEMRQMVEEDPKLGPQLRPKAKQAVVKGVFDQ